MAIKFMLIKKKVYLEWFDLDTVSLLISYDVAAVFLFLFFANYSG